MPTAADPVPHLLLRAATARSHDVVDAAFSRFDLSDEPSYAAFLTAHARVVPVLEAMLTACVAIPDFTPRTPALTADLLALGLPAPPRLDMSPPASTAAMWGMFYVIEGSRLGGIMLSRRVPAGIPKAYLAAAHDHGGWRRLLGQFDRAAAENGSGWLEQAIVAARDTFALYAQAATLA